MPLGKLLRLTIFIDAMAKNRWSDDNDFKGKVVHGYDSPDAFMEVVGKNDIYEPFYAVRDNTAINGNGINYNVHDGNRVGDQLDVTKEVSTWIPVIGDFMDLKDFYDSYKSGDKAGMLLAAAGLVPLIGGVSSSINRARKGIKKVTRSEHDIIKDDELVSKFPKYAKPNSPIGDALNRHRLRLERGSYKRLVGEDPSIIGFDKDRNPILDFAGIDFDLKSVKDKSSIEALMDDFGISEKEAIEYLKSVEDEPMFAVGSRIYWNPDILDKGGEEVKMYLRDGFNDQSKNVMVSHEVDHVIHTPNEKPEGNGFDFSKLSDEAREYFSYENGTEIAARGSQVKDYFGMTNDAQRITPEMLEYAKRHYVEDYGVDNNMSDFFSSITDFEKAAKWLSTNASAGLGTYWLLDRNLKPDKDKVEIKYQKKLDGGSIFLYGFRRIPGNNIYIPKPIKEKMEKMKNGGAKNQKDGEIYQLIADKFSAMYKDDVERVGRGEPARFFGQLNDKPLENVNPEFDLLFSPVKGLGSAAKAGSSYGISSEAVGRTGSILKEIGTGILRWDDVLRNGTRTMVDEVGKRLSGKARDFWDKYPGGLIKAFVGKNSTNMLPAMIGLDSEDNDSVSFQEAFKEASDQGLGEFEWNGKVYTTDKKKNGGVIGLKLSESDEKKFKDWYGRLSEYKGLNPNPDDASQYYDYRGFWKENPELAERMLNDDPDAHFVDTYKLPGHPTFSNESKYGGKELGGEWVEGDDGRGYYKPSPYTSSYIDRTIDHPYYAERDNTNIPGAVYSDKFEKLGDELPFVGLIPEVSVSAELNPEEYREAMKRAEARRGRNYVYAGQKEAFPLLAGITGLGAASSLAGAGILGPVLNTSMDALGVISNPLDPTNYLSIYPGGLSLGKNIRDYLPDDYVALKDMEMHVPEETLSAIAGNFKRNIASKFPKYYDDADISAARRFESGLRGESLSKYRDIVDFIRDNDIRDYKDLKEISSGLSQNEMMSVKGYISRRNQNIYNRDDMLKRVESYISDLDNFRYSDSFDLGEGIGGMYNRRFDLVAVNPYAGSETVIHELRHRMDTGPNAIKLNPMQLIYLDDAYKVGTNPMIESSGEQFEKIATNAELFERYRRKYKKYRKENGIDSSKYSIDDLYKYIDEQDPEDMLIELEHINAYGSDYANSIREYAGESHDKLNERIGKLKKALNYTPSILMGVSSYLSNGDNDYRDGGLIEKQDYIYNRLTSEYDIPPMQAAAIVANLTHESGLRTGALGDSGASYGLQQWRDERRKNLNQFAKERGHVEPTIDDQIDYLMYEYNNGRAFQFSTRGQNLYQTGKSKNKMFDYYQFSKSDFDNAASLRDAVIAWNQGVGRPNKEFSMNDRRYKIAADIAYRHGIKDGEKNYYNDMGYLPDGEMSGIHLPEVDIVANQPSQIPTEEQKKTDYYNTYGRQIVSQMMSFKPESQSVPTSQDVSKESDKMYQDAVRISKAIAENKEAEKRKMLIEAFLPNIQLAVKGVTQVGK